MATAIPRSNRYPAQMSLPLEAWHTPQSMAHFQFRAMGTSVSALVPEEDLQRGEVIVRTLFTEWEQALSRFLPQSELSQLNRQAGSRSLVSELLFNVLSSALDAAKATDGLYDPTLLNQLVQLGYDRSFNELPERQLVSEHHVMPGGGWRHIQVERTLRQVTLPAGVALDFGGIAKGMAVDAALLQLRRAGIPVALVNAGGDLAVQGVLPQEKQWPIEVRGRTCSWVIPLLSGAFATSGLGLRRWRQGEHERHHLVDPRTGLPAQSGLWSVTAAAAHCEQAEVAAKVAFLLGLEEGSAFLLRHGLAGLLVREDGSWETVGNWPREAMLNEYWKESIEK